MTLRGIPLCLLLVPALCACRDDSGPRGHKSPAPVRIEGGTSEQNAALLHLQPEAVARLGIETVAAVRRRVQSWRLLPAEVVAAPGSRTDVSAPFAGRVMACADGRYPAALEEIEAGEPVLRLEPLLSPEREVFTPRELLDLRMLHADASAARAAAEARRDGANLEVQRAERLAASEVGSQRRLDEALTAARLAAAEVEAAAQRQSVLAAAADPERNPEPPPPLTIPAPRRGLLEDVLVQPGQLVPAGAVLFRVRDHRSTWVRVPVYAGELAQLDPAAPARIAELADPRGEHSLAALPVDAPLALAPGAATIELFYAVETPRRPYRPGERLLARLPRKEEATALVVPWSALLFDATGKAWVYVQEGEGSFRRAGVLATRREGDEAVLERGPAVGSQVVRVGAAELFGTEFGTGK